MAPPFGQLSYKTNVGDWYFTDSVKIPVYGTQVDVQNDMKGRFGVNVLKQADQSLTLHKQFYLHTTGIIISG